MTNQEEEPGMEGGSTVPKFLQLKSSPYTNSGLFYWSCQQFVNFSREMAIDKVKFNGYRADFPGYASGAPG